MNSHNISDNEMDALFAHSIKNWGAKQNPPEYMRARILRTAAASRPGTKVQRIGKNVLMRIRGLNPYWTGRPLSHTELAKWLFSKAMLESLLINRDAMRVVC